MKYIIMFAGSTDDQEQWEKMPKDQAEAAYARIGKWFEEHTHRAMTGSTSLPWV